MQQKVDITIAASELEKWLDHKQVGPIKREKYATMSENIIEAICEGNLVLEEDFTFVFKPKFGIPGADTLRFKDRITQTDKEKYKKVYKGDTFADHLMITISALTDAPLASLKALDETVDRPVVEAIAVFFVN